MFGVRFGGAITVADELVGKLTRLSAGMPTGMNRRIVSHVIPVWHAVSSCTVSLITNALGTIEDRPDKQPGRHRERSHRGALYVYIHHVGYYWSSSYVYVPSWQKRKRSCCKNIGQRRLKVWSQLTPRWVSFTSNVSFPFVERNASIGSSYTHEWMIASVFWKLVSVEYMSYLLCFLLQFCHIFYGFYQEMAYECGM